MFIAINASNSISKGLLQINNQKKMGRKTFIPALSTLAKKKEKEMFNVRKTM